MKNSVHGLGQVYALGVAQTIMLPIPVQQPRAPLYSVCAPSAKSMSASASGSDGCCGSRSPAQKIASTFVE